MFGSKAPAKPPRQSVSSALQSAPPVNVVEERLLSLYIMPDDPLADAAMQTQPRASLAARGFSAIAARRVRSRSSAPAGGGLGADGGKAGEALEAFFARIEERDRQPDVLAAEARGESPSRSAPIV